MIQRLAMLISVVLLGSGLVGAAFLPSVWAQAGPPKFKLKMAHTFVAGALAPTWSAAEAGYFDKYNLNVEFVRIGAIAGEAALIAGEVNVLLTAPDELIPPIAGGAELVIIATQNNHPEYKLVVVPEIRKPEDLKGKRLAISRVGASSDWLTRNALTKLGVSPDSVNIIGVGGQGERAAALQARKVDGTVIVPPAQLALEKAGMRTLVDLADLGIPYVSVSYGIRKAFLRSNPDELERLLKAYGEGMHRFKTDRDFGKMVIAKRMRMSDEEIIGATYEYYATDKVTQRIPYISMEALKYLLEQTAKTIPAAAQVKLQDIADMSIVKKLDDSGFYTALYR